MSANQTDTTAPASTSTEPKIIVTDSGEILSEREQYLRRVAGRVVKAGLADTPKEAVKLMQIYGVENANKFAKMSQGGLKVSLSGSPLPPPPPPAVKTVVVVEEVEAVPAAKKPEEVPAPPKKTAAKLFNPDGKQDFFKDTVADAIEVLDISRGKALRFIKQASVTKLAKIVEIAGCCPPERLKMIAQSKRPFDQIDNYFPKQLVLKLQGKQAVLDLIKAYRGLTAA